MSTLRWTLGLVIGLGGPGLLVITVIAGGFRCAFIARESAFTAMIGVLYAAGWFSFYYRTVVGGGDALTRH